MRSKDLIKKEVENDLHDILASNDIFEGVYVSVEDALIPGGGKAVKLMKDVDRSSFALAAPEGCCPACLTADAVMQAQAGSFKAVCSGCGEAVDMEGLEGPAGYLKSLMIKELVSHGVEIYLSLEDFEQAVADFYDSLAD